MARVNVEDSLFKDNRFIELVIATGSLDNALGALVHVWIVAQKFWFPNRQPIPKKVWEDQRLNTSVVVCRMAEDVGDGYRVIGSEEQFVWLFQRSEAGKKGGPAATKARIENKENSERRETSEDNGARRSTSSYSYSSSSSKKEEREAVSPSELSECLITWEMTLTRMGIQKPATLDESEIVRLLQRHGYEKTKLALLGAGFEEESKDYKPKKHVSIRRLNRPDLFETFVNLGAQNKPKQEAVTQWQVKLS